MKSAGLSERLVLNPRRHGVLEEINSEIKADRATARGFPFHQKRDHYRLSRCREIQTSGYPLLLTKSLIDQLAEI
jgi:hypothetical protein